MVSRYVTNGPVKDGICLLPPTHYRMLPPQRTDAFHVPTQPYVPPQQPNQPGNQAQTLRGIAPAGPPNQASTPPTNDLKVQSVQQPQSMNPMYVGPQQQVRGTQASYYRSGPPSQPARMPSQHRGQIYQAQAQYMQMPGIPTQLYIANATTMQYYNGQRPQAYVQPTNPLVYQGQPIASQFPFQPNPNQPPAALQFSLVPVPFYPMRQTHPTQQATVPQNPNQPLPGMGMQQSQPPFQRHQNKRRAKAIPIIDPDTGVDKLDEVFEQQNSSHPPSGESSARQTPQPSVNIKEIQMAFTKQVLQVVNNDTVADDGTEVHTGNLEHESAYHHSNSQSGQVSKLDHLVQSSNLKAQAKEFVLSSNTAKETTPIVSALSDAVEVTLPNKQVKDRESPAKGRKQKEQQQQQREHKDSIKEVSTKEKQTSDKDSSITKNDSNNKSTKETLVTSANIVAPPVTLPPAKDNKEVVTQREDKKNQKKDSKTETNVPNVEVNENVNIATNQQVPLAQDVATSGKSKNTSQRTKDGQKQQSAPSAPTAKQATAPVPTPQPSKPNSKTSKKSELNQKGANKEGTDMDAFNDNTRMDAVNANISCSTNNEINANSVANNANTAINNDVNKKTTTDVSTFRTETKTFDVTDIVKEQPKPPTKAAFPQSAEAQDELDRAAPISNENFVQVKNEANAKTNSESSTPSAIELKSDLPYKEGQWTPNNPDGDKKYDKDFLLALRYGVASRKKPDNLPEAVIQDERGRLSDGRFSMGGRTDFAPSFPSYGGKSNSQRGTPLPKRNSQSGKLGGGGGKGNKNSLIKVSISVKEDVKLNQVENAWKPARFLKSDTMTDDDRQTEELYKKVRGVLNKLTPQKFDTLVGQVRELEIDTEGRLQGVIDLVFEKAVDEPNFSVAYALMCRELGFMQVPSASANTGEEKKEFVQFRKLLISRCQSEFEKQSIDENARKEKVKEIEENGDPEKKKELLFELEDYDRRLRMKSVGNIRFIGELFKQQMLTTSIMMRCLTNLLLNKDEESLECLCKLLTTIGRELERGAPNKKATAVDLSGIFTSMQEIVDKKHGKISSRVRFMLQDVIDLRRSMWVPRRQDLNPKTIDQIQKEAENEQLNIQAMNSMPMTPRKDDRGASSSANSDRKRRNVSDDGWQMTSNRNSRTPFTVQSDKLKNKPPQTDEPLGNRQMFGNWSKGSNIKSEPSSTPNTANMYAALENMDTEKRPSSTRSNKDPYSSKGPSLERSNYKQFDGRNSRSGSQHRSTERETTVPTNQKVPQTAIPPAPKEPVPIVPIHNLSEEQLERHVKNNLDEYLNDSLTIEEYWQDTQSTVASGYLSRLVADGYLHVLERSETARKRTGYLFAKSIKMEHLPLEEYCFGLEEILSQVDELQIDIPMIWDYLAEILVSLVCEEALPLSTLQKSSNVLIRQDHGTKLLGPLFKLVVSEKGPNFLNSCWHKSGLDFTDFVKPNEVDKFLNDNQLVFLRGGDTTECQAEVRYDVVHKKLLEFFSTKTSFDDIVNWIIANVGKASTDNKFIRTLATAIFEHSIKQDKKYGECLKDHYKLLQLYVDNNSNYELQCLFALQALINQLEHPKGLLLAICNQLYEDSIISQDSFIYWETNDNPQEQEGKGVALKQLVCFFTQLRENEEESGSSSDET